MHRQKRASHTIREQGFTLAEILIAIAILAVLLSLLSSSYIGVIKAINLGMPGMEARTRADVAMTRISEDLLSLAFRDNDEEGADQAMGEQFPLTGTDQEINGRAADGLTFASSAHIRFSEEETETARSYITYSVEEDETGRGLILFRADRGEFIAEEDPRASRQILCDQVAGVDFTYFDDQGRPHEQWDGEKIPRMVSVRLELLDNSTPEGRHHLVTTDIILPVSLSP